MLGVWRRHYRAYELSNAAEDWDSPKARSRGPFFAWLKTMQGFILETCRACTEATNVPH